jgi:hypothetical protein
MPLGFLDYEFDEGIGFNEACLNYGPPLSSGCSVEFVASVEWQFQNPRPVFGAANPTAAQDATRTFG